MPDRFTEKRSVLPPSYVEFIEKKDGWEGDLGEAFDFDHVIIWDKKSLQRFCHSYQLDQYLDARWFPFGSNGGGEMLCFDLENRKDRVFYIPLIGMSGDEAWLRYESFQDVVHFINESCGLDL